MVAFARTNIQALNSMMRVLPFPSLPLGTLMDDHQPHLETFQAALDGLDVHLLKRWWKLQVLDLHQNSHQNFWTTWSGITARVCSLLEPEPAQPMQKRQRAEAQAGLKPTQAPVQVLVDLCLKEDILDQALCYLLKKAKQKRSLLHLCCQKLKIITMPMQSISGILKVVQLDSVQDLEVNCTWKLATLSRFVPHLGWMGNLCWLLLWHIHLLPHTDPDKEEYCVSQLTA
ncbi:hypothetical protein E5288_WYG005079 [Bos mutus]|uniref:Uncharacterized protein n=1 Tax=Bos mutus TaxID=72004 RepID=A0A6B0S9K6_9CETA|nr:hypothetical protein [Bos mutus]